jgi:arginyl-tRNA synthetase
MDNRAQIIDWLAEKTGAEAASIDAWLEVPPQTDLGDYAFPCFQLARKLRKSPQAIASQLAAEACILDDVDTVKAVGGYLNFYLNRSRFIARAIRQTVLAGNSLGTSQDGAGKTVIIEYSSPNIAKPPFRPCSARRSIDCTGMPDTIRCG